MPMSRFTILVQVLLTKHSRDSGVRLSKEIKSVHKSVCARQQDLPFARMAVVAIDTL
jgi:hypothetical protein